jgi:transposase
VNVLMLPSAVGLPGGSRVWLAAGITDMRAGFNSLAAKVQTYSNATRSVVTCSSSGGSAAICSRCFGGAAMGYACS